MMLFSLVIVVAVTDFGCSRSVPDLTEVPPSVCVSGLTGNFLPKGYNCSDLYYQCRNYVLTEIVCPNKLSFDPVQDICIRVRDNGLCRDNPCFRLDDGLYPHPAGDCGRYMRCDSGWAVFALCEAPGLVWNQAVKQCTDASLVPPPCGPPPPPTTTVATNPTTTTPFACPSRDGIFASLNLPCPGFYWKCHPSGSRRIKCPKELSYDHKKNGCFLVAMGSCYRIKTNPFGSKNPCEGIADGPYPHPAGNCDSYMRCVDGWALFIQCENAEHVWNNAAKQCSPRSQVAPPCGSFVTTPATDPPTRPPTPPPFSCEGKRDGNHRETGTLCLSFFNQCHRDSLPKRVSCPNKLRYDHLKDKCIRLDDCLKKFNVILF